MIWTSLAALAILMIGTILFFQGAAIIEEQALKADELLKEELERKANGRKRTSQN